MCSGIDYTTILSIYYAQVSQKMCSNVYPTESSLYCLRSHCCGHATSLTLPRKFKTRTASRKGKNKLERKVLPLT